MTGNRHTGQLAATLALAFSLLAVATANGQSGIDQRIPWETSQVQGTPDPPLPYMTRIAFPSQQFLEPLATGQLQPLSVDGSRKVIAGLTSVTEVLRVIGEGA